MCFPQNARHGELRLENKVVITVMEDAKIIVTSVQHSPRTLPKREAFLRKGGSLELEFDSALSCTNSEVVEKNGIHIESTGEIGVLALSRRPKSADSYRVMPVDQLGDRYMVIGYAAPYSDNTYATQFNIVATEDSTFIAIDLSASTKKGRSKEDVVELTLGKGEVYTVQGNSEKGDLTGTIVSADKPVAVFTGHMCAQVPYDVLYCDVLVEQAQPRTRLAREFILPRFEKKDGYSIRVLASEDLTIVNVGNQKAVLNGGEYFDFESEKSEVLVRADKPIVVAQFAQGAEADTLRVGDPFMILVGPTSSFMKSAVFTVPIKRGEWDHLLSVVIPTDAIESIKFGGQRAMPHNASQVKNTEYSVVVFLVEHGSHIITADKPFGLYSYGFGYGYDNYDSYGTYCGGW